MSAVSSFFVDFANFRLSPSALLSATIGRDGLYFNIAANGFADKTFMVSIFLLILLFAAVTTVWMGIDSRKHKIPIDRKPYGLNNGALAWFFSALLLWLITFPYYLYKRSVVLSERELARNPQKMRAPIASPHSDGRE